MARCKCTPGAGSRGNSAKLLLMKTGKVDGLVVSDHELSLWERGLACTVVVLQQQQQYMGSLCPQIVLICSVQRTFRILRTPDCRVRISPAVSDLLCGYLLLCTFLLLTIIIQFVLSSTPNRVWYSRASVRYSGPSKRRAKYLALYSCLPAVVITRDLQNALANSNLLALLCVCRNSKLKWIIKGHT